MLKKMFAFLCILVLSFNFVAFAETDVMNGDLDLNHGAKEYKMTIEDLQTIKEKEKEMLEITPFYDPDGYYYSLRVPVFEQETNYYCGPATTKQVIHYINGYSSSQDTYANRLGTTRDGTDMNRIVTVLKNETGKNYVYNEIGSYNSWLSKIEYGMKYDMPAVLDIDTRNVRAFPYSSRGHFVNTSGLDVGRNTSWIDVRITDPYGPGLGNKWYDARDLYDANDNHWRHAMIY